MRDSLASVKDGEVTYAIKNTIFGGRKIKKNDFMSIQGKDVVANGKDRLSVSKKLIDSMIDEGSELVTIIYGADVKEEEVAVLTAYISDKHDVEVEIIEGQQPLYSFYIGVE
jgi:dihydroxyacetone kinase-like predicted kinase